MPTIDYDPQKGIVEIPDDDVQPDAAAPEAKAEGTPAPNASAAQPQQQDAEPQQPDADVNATPTQPFDLKLPPEIPARELPDGADDIVADFAKVAADAGMRPGFAQRLVTAVADATVGLDYQHDLVGEFALDDATEHLRKEWGTDFDRRMSCVRHAVAQLGPKVREYLDDTGLGNHPGVLQVLSLMGERDGVLSLTPAAAKAKIDRVMSDPKHPFWTAPRGSAERKRVATEMRLMHAIASEGDTPAPAPAQKPTVASGATAQADARAEIKAMLSDKTGPLMNRGHRDHAEAVRKFTLLTAKLS